MDLAPGLLGATVAIVAIACVTVAVCLGHVGEQAFVAIVSAGLGGGIGAGAFHAGTTRVKR